MVRHARPQVSSRKQPKQARAHDLVAAVLDAAVQVLRSEGSARFTTARVAERAGVSVGPLCQYFPNKAAILFRLQSDEWRRTTDVMVGLLKDASAAPAERLRRLVHAFLRSECDEARVRTALADAAPLYRDAPEAEEARVGGSSLIRDFVAEALPDADTAARLTAADLIETTLASVGSSFSAAERTEVEIATYADAMADMFCAYLERIAAGRAAPPAVLRPPCAPWPRSGRG